MPRSSLSSFNGQIWLQRFRVILRIKTLFPECSGAVPKRTETLDIPLKYQYHSKCDTIRMHCI